MNALLAHSGFRAQGDGAPIPGTWVLGNIRSRHDDGLYVVRCIDVRQPRATRDRERHKIEFVFAILGGPYTSTDAARADVPRLADAALPSDGRGTLVVPLFCNVKREGKVWNIGARSNLYEVISLVLGDGEPPSDADPAMLLAGRAFIAKVVSVERDWRKQPLPLHHRYSKIERLIEHVPELDECPDEGPVPF